MNFSKLKLNNYLVENAPGVEITSNNPATRNSKTSGNMANAGINKQIQGTVNSRAAQTKQSTGQTTGGQGTNSVIRKKSPTLSDTQMNVDQPVATSINSSYDAVKAHVELIKLRESSKSDWRQEIMEAANPNDDPDHPFVEVMPFNDYRMKEAQKNMVKAAQKDRQSGGITQMPGMKEEKEILSELAALATAATKLAPAAAKAGTAAKAGAASKSGGLLNKVSNIAGMMPSGGSSQPKKEKKTSSPPPVKVSSSAPIGEAKVVVGGDPQPLPDKKESGKALPKGNRKSPVRNYDNTATPAENEARRVANAVPQMKGSIGKKLVKRVETDAFSGK